jgi:hypothetical protein
VLAAKQQKVTELLRLPGGGHASTTFGQPALDDRLLSDHAARLPRLLRMNTPGPFINPVRAHLR